MLTTRLKILFENFPVVVVTGARQVGKSTLVSHIFGDKADCVVFDPVQDIENARQDPELFLDNHRVPIILDEIQYAPELVPAIKRRIDQQRRPGQYILTGSHQWGVLKAISESLAGRAVFLDLQGFSLVEIIEPGRRRAWLPTWLKDPDALLNEENSTSRLNRSVYEQLWRGWLPEAQRLGIDLIPDFHLAYRRTYIERDVRMQADVSDLQLFGRFVGLCAALTSQEINYGKVGRDLGITAQTSKRWLDIMTATFQWFVVPAFYANLVKRVSSRAKGYINDTGLACYTQAISSPTAIGGHPLWGALFETAVVGEIRKQAELLAPPAKMYHWRAYSGAEVDLIIERDNMFYPFEVKAASNPARRDTTGISAFRKAFPHLKIQKGLVIAPVESIRQISDHDYTLPWDFTLKS